MNNIQKITLTAFVFLAVNTVYAQSVSKKKEVKKAEATSVKSGSAKQELKTVNKEAVPAVSEKKAVTEQNPSTVKEAKATQVKTPTQRFNKPLKKAAISKEKKAVQNQEAK